MKIYLELAKIYYQCYTIFNYTKIYGEEDERTEFKKKIYFWRSIICKNVLIMRIVSGVY